MSWVTLKYSLADVNAAGEIFVKNSSDTVALDIINNWRAAHTFPLHTFQIYLRRKAHSVDRTALVAQRIKRLESINGKLYRMPKLKLSEMQDIGGCRAIVGSVKMVDALVKEYKKSQIKHKLIDEDNYIAHPKKSGYRSHHLIYQYYSDKKADYNGRKIEIQLRTQLQHAWATAVETVGTFTKQALKSNQGEKDWLRFFQLMATVIALKEGTPPVPNTPVEAKLLIEELRICSEKLQVERRLSTYGNALKILETKADGKSHFYILVLNPNTNIITVRPYKWSELDEALEYYSAQEQDIRKVPGGEAVLVSVNSIKSLKKAYPNYFLDTVKFRSELRLALGTQSKV